MVKWIKRLFSDTFLRVGLIFFIIETLLAVLFVAFILFSKKKFTGSISILLDILEILIMLSGILCYVFILIMAIRKCIYGNEAKHDKAYWKDYATAGTIMPVEIVNDPYLLAIRHKNPVPGFVISMLGFVSIPVLTYSLHIDFSDFGIKQIAILMPIIYVMTIVTVSLIRFCRRIMAFHVKINIKFKKGNKLACSIK